MHLIVVTDIFGKTKCLDEIVNHVSGAFTSVDVVDPYSGKEIDFSDETEAYEHFQNKMGLKKYSENLFDTLRGKENVQLTILGFSIGASAIWSLSNKLGLYQNAKAIGFYSSQIRNYLEVEPKISIDLYFSKTETSYDVIEIMGKLSEKEEVACFKTEYCHGFMNKKSVNFDSKGYLEYLKILKNG